MVIVFFELMAHLLVLLVVSTIEYKIGGSSVASASIKHVKCMLVETQGVGSPILPLIKDTSFIQLLRSVDSFSEPINIKA